jgi:hypothetical protein
MSYNSYDMRIGEMETFMRTSGKDISQLQSQIDAAYVAWLVKVQIHANSAFRYHHPLSALPSTCCLPLLLCNMSYNSYDTRIGEMETFMRTSGKDISQLQSQIENDKRTKERMEQAAQHGRAPRVGVCKGSVSAQVICPAVCGLG